ncbi:MAG: rhomboid family intramembrane serine protease, partial [Clostridia bacterium]|nr:rhomboid family intramembrane serine protease [Clostridia bacterium]
GALLYRMTLGKDARAFRAAGNFTWLAITVLFNLVYGLVTPGIDNYGHFGGFVGGFIAALLIGVYYDIRKAHK